MIALKRILVATDFSEPADAALAYGRAFARTFGATLYLLHVVDDMYVRFGGDAYAAVLPELQEDVEREARQRLARITAEDALRSLTVEAVVITSGATAHAIVDYAEKENVQLIVVGTHGRGGVAHLLMGSVAERVVRTAHCPVLSVRRPERDFVTPETAVASTHA
jgi:nucleotide-binding universal stress UspA family protein